MNNQTHPATAQHNVDCQLVAETFARIVIYHCGITPEAASRHIDLVLMAKGGEPRMLRIDRKSGAWVAQEYASS